MKQLVNFGKSDLQRGFAEMFQQVHGKPRGNPMAFTGPTGEKIKKWSDLKPQPKGPSNADAAYLRFWRAAYRDASYCTAGSPFLRSFGIRQAGREITDATSAQKQAGAFK